MKLDIYEAQILITRDLAGWVMSLICRVLQPDKSNLLSFKIQAVGSDHKLGHFSQETNKQTPQANEPKNQPTNQNPKQANKPKQNQTKPCKLSVYGLLRLTCFLLLMLNIFTM